MNKLNIKKANRKQKILKNKLVFFYLNTENLRYTILKSG
jgi:hypothetical protein